MAIRKRRKEQYNTWNEHKYVIVCDHSNNIIEKLEVEKDYLGKCAKMTKIDDREKR